VQKEIKLGGGPGHPKKRASGVTEGGRGRAALLAS